MRKVPPKACITFYSQSINDRRYSLKLIWSLWSSDTERFPLLTLKSRVQMTDIKTTDVKIAGHVIAMTEQFVGHEVQFHARSFVSSFSCPATWCANLMSCIFSATFKSRMSRNHKLKDGKPSFGASDGFERSRLQLNCNPSHRIRNSTGIHLMLESNPLQYPPCLRKQEAQLLLGDRATRKHAKDSWNGRGNDNLGWMTFKCTSSSSKVAPIES